MVQTPGAAMPRTISSTWRTMRPLRRILSNSACDLQLIIGCPQSIHQRNQLCCHLFDGKFAIHFVQTALLAVIIRQRPGIPLIRFQTLGYDCFAVIFALDERGAVEVTNSLAGWRL